MTKLETTRPAPARLSKPSLLLLNVAVVLLIGIATQSFAAVVQFQVAAGTAAKGISGTGVYDPVNVYTAPGGFGVAFLLPPVPIQLPLGGVNGGFINFQTKLNAAQGNYVGTGGVGKWSYVAAGASLANNALQMTSYDVHGGSDYVGIEDTPTQSGVSVHVNTPPAAGTPHWIQVIADNHALSGAHGTLDNKIDIKGTATTPYYDDSFAADGSNFLDSPLRDDPTNNHWWIADLYLVTGPATPGQVTVYDGLAYGWANIFVSTANLLTFANTVNGYFSNIAALDGQLGVDLSPFYDQAGLDNLDSEFLDDVANMPEPSSFALLCMAAAFLLFTRRGWLKRG